MLSQTAAMSISIRQLRRVFQPCHGTDFLWTGTRLFLISYDAGVAALLLAATALLASLIPALRAALVGPATVLRQE